VNNGLGLGPSCVGRSLVKRGDIAITLCFSHRKRSARAACCCATAPPDRDVKGGEDASRGGGEAADASLPRLSRLWSRCSAPTHAAARAHMRGSLVAQPALPLSAQALMREVETRLPGLGFMMIPVGLVAGHPEKQAVTPKVMSAALSPCASPAAFLLRNRLEREPQPTAPARPCGSAHAPVAVAVLTPALDRNRFILRKAAVSTSAST